MNSATLRSAFLGLGAATYLLLPPPTALAPHLSQRVVVDGGLEEWDTSHPLTLDRGTMDPRPGAASAWKGPSDASATLHLCWDDERLYLGGRVADDRLVVTPGNLWLGDSIEVFLRIPGQGEGGDYQLILCPLAQEVRWVFARFRGRTGQTDGDFDGVEVAGREIRDGEGAYRGYTFEAAVPLANFPGFDPTGASVGLNLALVDADEGPGQKAYLLWAGTTLPAYRPDALGTLRFEGARSPAAGPAEKGFGPGLESWKVPGLILAGTLGALWLLIAFRRPLRRLGDLPIRRKVPLALAAGLLLVGLRLLPGLVESRRESRAADRLGAAEKGLLSLAEEAARANILVPGRTVDPESPLLRLVEGRRVSPQPEYQYLPLPAVPRPPRRTLASGTPVRATEIPLDGAGRVAFRLRDPVEASELRVVLSWREPGERRAGPPPGTVVGRIHALSPDGTDSVLEIRTGLEVDDESAARDDGHGATVGKVAWLSYDPAGPSGAPAGHADEVSWVLPGGPGRIVRLEAEQVVPEGVLVLRGITALPPGGGDPVLLPLGRTTQEGVPTGSWNGQPAAEVLHLGPETARRSVPIDAEADAVFVVYSAPGGFAAEQAGKRVASLHLLLEDGTATAPVFLENGVNLDAARLAGIGHPEDFKGTLAFRWPGPTGVQLHRDSLALPAGAPPGVKVRSLEVEVLGADARVDIDAVTAGRRMVRPAPPGLTSLDRQGEGFERSRTAGAALEGVFVTHYRAGRAVATTLPADVRDRVLGTEAPPEIAPRGEAGLPGAVYVRNVAGRSFLARQARLPFRDADEVIETAVPAPDARDLETPVLVGSGILLALFLTLALTSAIDALEFLHHLSWKLVGAFVLAAVLPLVVLTLYLARHFEAAVDRGIEQELRAHADAAARGLAVRRDEARRLAEDLLKDDTLRRALDTPDDQDRAAQVDAVVREFARRAGGGAARVSLEVVRSSEGGVVRRTYPLRETPAPFQDLYEPADGLDYRWSRLVATGVARARTPAAGLRLVVEIPVDDRVLGDTRRAGGDRAQFLLYSPSGYPVAGTAEIPSERSPEAAAARRAAADDLRRAPGEPEIRSRDLGGLPHAVAYDLVRSADGRTIGLLATAVPRQPLLAAALGTRDLVLLLGSAAFLVAVIVANLVTRRLAGPVAELARVARAIEGGDLKVRAAGGGRDEIASLAVAFNRMTGQLEGRIGELSLLNRTQATFSATLDRERVLELTLAAYRESANPWGMLVLLARPEGGDVEAAAGLRGEEVLGPRVLSGSGFLGSAVRETSARVVPLPAGTEEERALLRDATEAVVLPFAAGRGRTSGAVVLLRRAPVAGVSLDFLAALAHQAGIALENARLYRLAAEDTSSGLYAASYFKRRLQEEIDRSLDAGRPATLLLLGVEGLGAVFDRSGPDEGNAVLREVVARIRGEVRRMHLLGRAGRDVVAVLLPETAKAAAEESVRALRAAVEGTPFAAGADGPGIRLGLTPAVATAPDDAGSAEFLENEGLRVLELARARRRGAPAEPVAAPGLPGVDRSEAEALGFRSAKSLLLLDALNRIAVSDVPVLVLGETGAGKEVVADVLHGKSRRSAGPLVKVNCAALPGPLLEAELFGYERGAFTGADRRHAGRFEQASGGTLFLDEVGELPPALQVKLLRVLQDRKVERLGGSGPVEVDVRVLAATNRDLPAMIEAGSFREDLYFRLNVLSVVVPPLRARREDIPPLAARFLEAAAARHGSGPSGFSPEALDFLFRHPFPGNVRELRNMVERSVVAARGPLVTVKDLSFGEEREGLRLGTRPAVGMDAPVPPPPAPARHGLSDRSARLLAAIRARGSLTNRDWCEVAGVSARTGLRDFEELMEKGLVVRSGKRRSASYRAA